MALKMKTEMKKGTVFDPLIPDSTLGVTLRVKTEMLRHTAFDYIVDCKSPFKSDPARLLEMAHNVKSETLVQSEILNNREECKSTDDVNIPVSSSDREAAQDLDKDYVRTLLTCRIVLNTSRKGEKFHTCDDCVLQCKEIDDTKECEIQEDDTEFEPFLGWESPSKPQLALKMKTEMLEDTFDHFVSWKPQLKSDCDPTLEMARNVENETLMKSEMLIDTKAEYRSTDNVDVSVLSKLECQTKTVNDSHALLSSHVILNTSKKQLKSRMLTHVEKSRLYCCKICDKRFSQTGNLKRHIKSIHGNTCETCPHCMKRYNRRDRLLQHIRIIHMGDHPYCCDICKKHFDFKESLVRHVRCAHTNDKCNKPGKQYHCCNLCKKRYIRLDQLRCHLRIHNADYPYLCAHCKRKFNQKKDLILHVRIHVKNIPHFCNYCKMKFSRNIDLKRHKWAVHFGKDLYCCYHCNKQFIQKAKLARHMPIHSVRKINQPYVCTICKKQYAGKYRAKMHMRTCRDL